MTATYEFERSFRLKILSLLLDDLWLTTYGKILIKPEYFDMEDEEAFARSVLEYHETYGHSPADPDDVIVSMPLQYADVAYKIYDIYDDGELSLAKDKALEFAKNQAIRLALLESVDDVEKGNFADIITRFEEAMKIGDAVTRNGIDPVGDVDKWLYDYWQNKVRTGMYHIDMLLEGGLGAGELGLIMGPPGRGKSMGLINIGYGAAGLGSGKNIVHFTHEMSEAQVAKRYAARMTFRFPQKTEDLHDYEDTLIETARRFMPGKIRIIGGSKMTFTEVESHLDRLQDDGFDIGLIIDDYADLMTPTSKYTERRYELSSLYEEWRATGSKYGCPVWSATQSNRGSLSKEIITMADIAEDIGKAAIADVIVAFCQTYEEKQAEQARLFMAKIRDGASNVPLVACKWYSDSQAIVTTGYVKTKEGKDV